MDTKHSKQQALADLQQEITRVDNLEEQAKERIAQLVLELYGTQELISRLGVERDVWQTLQECC